MLKNVLATKHHTGRIVFALSGVSSIEQKACMPNWTIGNEYWISGIKRRVSKRHWAGSAKNR